MIEHFRNLPAGAYPPDGCALLVRDAWQKFLGLSDLPEHADRFVTVIEAKQTMATYDGVLLEPIQSPEHLCMVVATRGAHWHCGVYTIEQQPGYVIHTLGKAVKIEPLNLFKRRFDSVEFYRYATHHRVQTPDKAG
ncbi:hypothetical protein [Vibrio hippocampi]|uniref:NlpC/P60 domain-containing protein n=1 Tax=Vibrio hippocampi TaxID=654686 RepID=A0ABM8ZP92_9VIBR|nr:hypothetical protein [Vibrio hippocampi]CAH0531207.1 hypothetical protein VHP8226_04144 [Vibrio hippocampi]